MSSHRLRARVIGVLEKRFVKVLVGEGLGLLDGGVEMDIPIEFVPVDLRIPNSEFDLVMNPLVQDDIVVERIEPFAS